ncbi:MAG: ATP-dependent DNA helicase RecG [Eubacteriales bacterium]|nr:ATP-dependent DNA helicase RecG [Eubacteriales bacterium]
MAWAQQSITTLKGVGEVRAKALARLGIETLGDAALFLPRTYHDLSACVPLASIPHEGEGVVLATVTGEGQVSYARRNMSVMRVPITDGQTAGTAIWYNQPFLTRVLRPDTQWVLYGRVEGRFAEKRLVNPGYEPYEVELPGLVPVYPITQGVSQKVLRGIIAQVLAHISPVEETLPEGFRLRNSLCELNYALQNIHFPIDGEACEQARRRLAFEEMTLFLLMLRNTAEARRGQGHGRAFACARETQKRFADALPFSMTGAQKRVLGEIVKDMRAMTSMNRLVQGDVGCGKTALALGALYFCAAQGRQGALMAPTEILAQQHYEEAKRLLEPLGVRIALLKGGQRAAERREVLRKIKEREADVVVGTHALIQKGVEYADLGLVVTDEQHRFGVRQRSDLAQKGTDPDMLVMSATPVPRTLALILYGDLDVSVVDELPPGRKPVRTRVVPPEKQRDMYRFVRGLVEKDGQQVYVVCPLIEDSDKLEVNSAQGLYEELKKGPFAGLSMALVHGRLSAQEKEAQLEAFRRGETQVIVSTTVIEVGVNVPNASVMVIENADRFGLAQLHQLRGRVGRGGQEAWCFLLTGGTSQELGQRLRIMCQTNDGFRIAQADLEVRGPGEFLGTRQSGIMDIHVLRLMKDMRFVSQVDEAVRQLDELPYTQEKELLLQKAQARFASRLEGIILN